MGEVKTRDHRVFVGKLDPDTLGLAERLIVKAFQSPKAISATGRTIREWAQEITSELLKERVR